MRKRGLCCRCVSVRPSQLVDCIQTAVRKKDAPFFEIFNFKNAVTLKNGLEVREGH